MCWTAEILVVSNQTSTEINWLLMLCGAWWTRWNTVFVRVFYDAKFFIMAEITNLTHLTKKLIAAGQCMSYDNRRNKTNVVYADNVMHKMYYYDTKRWYCDVSIEFRKIFQKFQRLDVSNWNLRLSSPSSLVVKSEKPFALIVSDGQHVYYWYYFY